MTEMSPEEIIEKYRPMALAREQAEKIEDVARKEQTIKAIRFLYNDRAVTIANKLAKLAVNRKRSFLHKDGKPRATVVKFARELNSIGGFQAMYLAAECVPKAHQRALDCAFDGVGTWRA